MRRSLQAGVAMTLIAVVLSACAVRPGASSSTATPTPAGASQPVGTARVYGWDGVNQAVLMSRLGRTSAPPGGPPDWTTWMFAGRGWSVAPPLQALPPVQPDQDPIQVYVVYDSGRRVEVLIALPDPMLLYGSSATSGVWESDGHGWLRRTTAHSLPKAGSGLVSVAYYPDLRAVVLIDTGFMQVAGSSNTAWLYDGSDWRVLTDQHWPQALGHLSYDPARHELVALDERFLTWTFDGKDWTQVPGGGDAWPTVSGGMGTRAAAAVAFDPTSGRWVLFGGSNGETSFGDTWTGDGSTWRQEKPGLSPPARSAAQMVWDPVRKKSIMFGGQSWTQVGLRRSGVDFGDTWAWDGSSWAQLAGPAYPPQPNPSPASTPASAPRLTTPPPLIPPSASLLFAVVEGGGPQSQAGTVAIVGMDGYAKAKATFQPRTLPAIPDVAVPMQSPAQVVGGSVVYIDGSGVVRQLHVGAQPQTIATIAQPASQYETWFAVSPDRSHVVAGVLTLPALGPIPSNAPWPTLVGPWKFDLESATAGGATTNLLHEESTIEPDAPGATWKPTFPIAWTSAGAIGMVPISIGTQNIWYGGRLFVLDAAGKQSQPVGGADCLAATMTTNGFIPCANDQGSISIRDSAGNTIWTPQGMSFNALTAYVSPDGKGYSDGQTVETISSGVIELPSHLQVQGWLDDNTVVGRIPTPNGFGDLAWISIGDPVTVHDFGFKGDFVGTIG